MTLGGLRQFQLLFRTHRRKFVQPFPLCRQPCGKQYRTPSLRRHTLLCRLSKRSSACKSALALSSRSGISPYLTRCWLIGRPCWLSTPRTFGTCQYDNATTAYKCGKQLRQCPAKYPRSEETNTTNSASGTSSPGILQERVRNLILRHGPDLRFS